MKNEMIHKSIKLDKAFYEYLIKTFPDFRANFNGALQSYMKITFRYGQSADVEELEDNLKLKKLEQDFLAKKREFDNQRDFIEFKRLKKESGKQ